MQPRPFPGGADGEQAVLIDGHTLAPQRVDPFSLAKLVTEIMQITGQSWRQIVEETPFCAWLAILEAWKQSNAETSEIDVDKAFERLTPKAPRLKNVDEAKLQRFIATGGLNIRRR